VLIYLFAEKYIENEGWGGGNIYIYIYFVGLAKIILKADFWGLAKRPYAYY
jgi:transcription initiation factor IIF auxiliary subunit